MIKDLENDYDNRTGFFHTHIGLETELNLNNEHVIIDKEDFKKVNSLINEYYRIKKINDILLKV